MIDNRIITFLELCKLMNYRRTAEALNMTQPAVTQHIHHLENEYGCRLFTYQNRVLKKTEKCIELEKHALSMLYNEKSFRENIKKTPRMRLSIGATKTIGDYTIENKVLDLIKREDVDFEIIVDNTENLLTMLSDLKLDLLLIEGMIDKESYACRLIKDEELVGICAPGHRFAGKEVDMEDLFSEHILIREDGSGTRAVFENYLMQKGYSYDSFARKSQISSFRLIEKAIEEDCGISFVYESIPYRNSRISEFRIKGEKILHEFNYVFLKNTNVSRFLELME